MRRRRVTPHVARNTTDHCSAIDGRTSSWPGYAIGQRIRKRVEKVFDGLFASRDGLVLDVAPGRSAWRVGRAVWRAAWALELPVGAIAASHTRLDGRLVVVAAD